MNSVGFADTVHASVARFSAEINFEDLFISCKLAVAFRSLCLVRGKVYSGARISIADFLSIVWHVDLRIRLPTHRDQRSGNLLRSEGDPSFRKLKRHSRPFRF
jgi:hypothetical protein